MNKIKNFLLAVPFAAAPLVAMAEDQVTSVEIPSALSSISFTSLITSLAGIIAPALVGVLGLVAGIWVLQLVWRKIRATAR